MVRIKIILLFALAQITVGCIDAEQSETPSDVSAQVAPSASCADLTVGSAFEDLRACAEQRHAGAQYNLGVIYDFGRGMPEDHAEAVRWYRLAAVQGDARAQTNLGFMFATGRGVSKDIVEAERWYRLAAEQGHVSAQYNLGVMYASGEGVPLDIVRAYMWWDVAASQGEEGAQRLKDITEEEMTREQIAEAERLSREWIEEHPPGGN